MPIKGRLGRWILIREVIMEKVNRYTRAGKDGKDIVCPNCGESMRIYHFSWISLGCMYCKQMIPKDQWEVA